MKSERLLFALLLTVGSGFAVPYIKIQHVSNTLQLENINSCGNGSGTFNYFDQRAVLYSEKDQGGSRFIPQLNTPDLSIKNYDNCATSVCVTGIWLFYVEKGYNGNPNSGMEYVFGANNFCTNLKYVPGHVRSVRSVGSPADYRSDTLTLFCDPFFQGDSEYMYSDMAEVSVPGHRSLILTGTCGWTIYSEPNYGGVAKCIFPPKSNDFSPLFLSDLNSTKVNFGTIKSARKGCWEKAPPCQNSNFSNNSPFKIDVNHLRPPPK